MQIFYVHIKFMLDDSWDGLEGEVADTVLQIHAVDKQHAISKAHEEVPNCIVIDVFPESDVVTQGDGRHIP